MTPSSSASGRQPFFCSGFIVVVVGEENGSPDRSSQRKKAVDEESTKIYTRFGSAT